jgi:hypothetical protein
VPELRSQHPGPGKDQDDMCGLRAEATASMCRLRAGRSARYGPLAL